MKIGILGSAAVGKTLAAAFLSEGHSVAVGTRHPSKEDLVKWQKEHPAAKTGSYSEAAQSSELLVLAVDGTVAEEVIAQSGPENFSGKILVDATNPIAKAPPVNGVLQLFTTSDDSLMERIQKLIPACHVVKAFNSVGNLMMYKPDFGGTRPSMFICGNDDAAKKTVTEILDAFGWETEDMGKAEAARAIEPLCMLWCIPGFLQNQWTHAFKLLKK
jgi:predicted dinucleotide-binding enzyme